MAEPGTQTDAPATLDIVRKVEITPRLVYVIAGPYFAAKFMEQFKSLIPITAFLFLFQLIVIRRGVVDSLAITAGLLAVALGLMLFLEGVRIGLMPLGQNIGATLPAKAGLWLIMGFAFVLGTATTYAEPAISTLKAAGGRIRPSDSALLFEMLNGSSALMVASIGTGVGIATALGVYRFVRNWSLKVLLLPTIAIALVLTLFAELNPEMAGITALAWDAGAVTTGAVTVPLVLALGIGVTTVLGRAETGMFYWGGGTTEDTGSFTPDPTGGPTLVELVADSMQASLQAILPLVGLLYVVQRFVLKETVRQLDQILLGVAFAVMGMLLFNVGLGRGLIPLGEQVGGNLPSAFAPPEQLYGATGGRIIAIVFAFIVGYGATLAEPALNALSDTVEEITSGAFKKWLLAQAVAVGVGLGLSAGLAKIIFDWPITYLVIPGYLVLVGLTLLSNEKYVNIGWDSAGVTTGEITVPLVLAMGLGVGGAVGVADGFGMLTLASIGPILTVLALGLVVSRSPQASAPAAADAPQTTTDTS
jgi:hypothetical protein